jgi:hypothetical protein
VAFHLRITLRGILQRSDIGENQGICAVLRRHINGRLPAIHPIRMGKGIDGHVQLAAMLVQEARRFCQLLVSKIKASKVAGIGVIFQTDIHCIGAMLHRRFQRR